MKKNKFDEERTSGLWTGGQVDWWTGGQVGWWTSGLVKEGELYCFRGIGSFFMVIFAAWSRRRKGFY